MRRLALLAGCLACGSDPLVEEEQDDVDPTTGAASSSESTAVAEDTSTTAEPQESSGTSGTVPCDLEGAIDRDDLLADLAVLQGFADTHGNRSIITQGHYASAEWIAGELEAVGYEVVRQPVDFMYYGGSEDPRLAITGPIAVDYVAWEDFGLAYASPPGQVSGPARVVDVELGPGNASTSGCEPDDFSDFVAGEIAVLQAGGCWPSKKVANAEAAGASAVVLFNQGDVPARMDAFGVYLSEDVTVPVIVADYPVGEAMAAQPKGELVLDVAVNTTPIAGPSTYNVLAQTTGESERVIVVGAHLDTVTAGAGINDNGTGSVAVLALARALAACEPRTRVVFGWWSAEESGLWGARTFVESLTEEQREAVDLYLNLDMLASTNYVPFVLDGDGSLSSFPPSPGSDAIEAELVEYFADIGLVATEMEADTSSDQLPFAEHGIPVGFLSTGAWEVKTAEQVERYGGKAGEPLDPCYHLECDDLDNVNAKIFVTMTRAAAHIVGRHAL